MGWLRWEFGILDADEGAFYHPPALAWRAGRQRRNGVALGPAAS